MDDAMKECVFELNSLFLGLKQLLVKSVSDCLFTRVSEFVCERRFMQQKVGTQRAAAAVTATATAGAVAAVGTSAAAVILKYSSQVAI